MSTARVVFIALFLLMGCRSTAVSNRDASAFSARLRSVAMVEPQSVPNVDRLQNMTGCRIRPILVLEDNLVEYQRKYLAKEVTVDTFLASIEESDVTISETEAIDEGPVTDLDKMVDGSPVVNLVNLAILTARHGPDKGLINETELTRPEDLI